MDNSVKSCETLARNYTKGRKIVLTFDMGVENNHAREVLDVLTKYGVKATFFLTGIWAEKNADVGKLIVEQGHTIGCHSYDHLDYTTLTKCEVQIDLRKAENTIFKNINATTKPLFRAPYGSFNDTVLEACAEEGYLYNVFWSIDPRDWDNNTSEESIFNTVVKKAARGEIVLFHLNNINTICALDKIIPRLIMRKFKFVRLEELFEINK